MAPHAAKPPDQVDGPLTPDDPARTEPIGPPSGIFTIPTPYIPEQNLRRMLRTINSEGTRSYDESLEDKYRVKGVQLIENVRTSLQLPVKTFDTAATYYHKFRMRYSSSEYNYEDAALASLFVACKVEDTIKKSKEILCAAHNVKQPHDQKSSDDKVFESCSKYILALERHILETIGFDFRGQYPQEVLIKLVRRTLAPQEHKAFLRVAYDMSLDLYKTVAPAKQTTFTMVFAVMELTSRLTGMGRRAVQAQDPGRWHTNRGCVLETMLDLLDLYTHFAKSTRIGPQYDVKTIMDAKIELNGLLERQRLPRFETSCGPCRQEAPDVVHPITPGSATSPATTTSLPSGKHAKKALKSSEASVRFVFDAREARNENDMVGEYFNEQVEEYEVEVEEVVPPEEPRSDRAKNQVHRNSHNNHHDHGWSPYRSRHGQGHQKGRKGHY